MNIEKIRNFTIIAHIDHGKSTLADQFIKLSKQTSSHDFKDQMLDDMVLEQERGITIKARTVRINLQDHVLNLLDTPGHADFSYEVSRSLKCCDSSILLVDATKGVQSQTISHFYKAVDHNHYIIPVINKIDSPNSEIEKTVRQIENLGIDSEDIIYISAKTGKNIDQLIERIIKKSPHPSCDSNNHLQALVIDSWYDRFLGVISLVWIKNGKINKGHYIIGSNRETINIIDVGHFIPHKFSSDCLEAGEIGYVVTQLKDPSKLQVGDTIIKNENTPILDGFKPLKPLVYCDLYLDKSDLIKKVQDSLSKYSINDTGFTFQLKSTSNYGTAFHCGFLGVLHMEIVLERLYREFDVKLIPTLASVNYKVLTHNNEEKLINCPNEWENVKESYEPYVICTVVTQEEYIGKITTLCVEKRAENIQVNIEDQVIITCSMPMIEIINNFDDKLKSITNGYGSFDYEPEGYKLSALGKLMIIVNDEEITELAHIVHEKTSKSIGGRIVGKLKETIPRSQFKIKIQAAFQNKKNIVAREDISPYRKDVVAHCYGGDITRKKKLLEKQKKGKKRMINYGKISIPSDAVTKLLQ